MTEPVSPLDATFLELEEADPNAGLVVGVAALTSIIVGSALGLTVGRNVIADSADQPTYQGALHFSALWGHLAIVFVVVFAAALMTTLAPAARAARVRPAEALRYE